MTIRVRPEMPSDVAAVRRVTLEAFGQPLEADLVDRLRAASPRLVSLVADEGGQVLGHLLFTPVTIDAPGGAREGMGLAPMAVVPARQRAGIGTMLVQHGLALLQAEGCPFVVVVGHPTYYPRFGFRRASEFGIESQWAGMPDEAFMVLPIDTMAMQDVRGVARYRPEFDEDGSSTD